MRASLKKLLFSDGQQDCRDENTKEVTLAATSRSASTTTTTTTTTTITTTRPTSTTTVTPSKASATHSDLVQHPARRRDRRNGSGRMSSRRGSARAPQRNLHRLPSSQAARRLLALGGRAGPVAILAAALCLALVGRVALASEESAQQKQQIDLRSTQPTLDRQVETPSGAPSPSGAQAAGVTSSSVKPTTSERSQQHEQAASGRPVIGSAKPQKPVVSLAGQKKAAALAAQRDYDKYQLKASPSAHSPGGAQVAAAAAAAGSAGSTTAKPAGSEKQEKAKDASADGKPASESGSGAASTPVGQPAHKKIGQHPHTRQPSSAFALLKKLLPSFMTSAAGPVAAAAAAAASAAVADKQQQHSNQHSRSSSISLSGGGAGGPSSLLSSLLSSSGSSSGGSKIVNLLSGAQKKKGLPEGATSAIPNHAPFFMRKAATDRQASGGGALALASGLLSNPLKLGLLFSAPLLPSLLLTPLAIAGLSPAMSAINNFFGDDDEPATAASQSPLAAFASGSGSPLATILQATGASPFGSSSSSSSSGDSSSASSSSPANSFALQAFQSFLGPTSTTERPLFNPGMFASSGVQNAAGAISSVLSSGSGSGSSGSGGSTSGSGSRPLFGSGGGGGGGLMQAAASMISPSFASPPGSASGSASSDDDGPGLMQMASDVFEKVANYMGNDKDGPASSGIGQASNSAGSQPSSPANSPLSTLASLSSLSPFQLSSLFASTPLGSALAGASKPALASGGSSSSSGASGAGSTQRAGFFSTLRNVYELFSSSFLRRQEVGNENECQQRLVCELHQRAMNSKFFKRSLQSNLNELANLDKNLIEQIKYSSQGLQARVDPDTKAILSDFLKATNNFKSGREMINCSQMFPKCTRTQLLAAVNAHMSDPVNGRAIGKFSQLMKKMKHKSNQQHQSQWKLRKPSKGSASGPAAAVRSVAPIAPGGVLQPIDYAQVAPLAKPGVPSTGQLTPVDSLKLAQQIMMLSQQMPQQQVSSSQMTSQYGAVAQQQPQQLPQQTYTMGQQTNQYSQQSQPSQPQLGSSFLPGPYLGQAYSPAPSRQQTTYTDAVMQPVYSSTDSPYFVPAQIGVGGQQQPQQFGSEQQGGGQMQQQYPSQQSSLSQQAQPSQQQQQYVQPSSLAAGSSSQPNDQSMMTQQPQQQQGQPSNMDNKNQPQQLLTPKKSPVAVAA